MSMRSLIKLVKESVREDQSHDNRFLAFIVATTSGATEGMSMAEEQRAYWKLWRIIFGISKEG